MKNLIQFLSELKENNYKEWFWDHKQEFDLLRDNFTMDVAEIISAISIFDNTVKGLQPKDAIFRIYRDIRFSLDKTPYKTHFGAYMARGGRKGVLGGYYLHIEPSNSFISVGIWNPQKDVLESLRNLVYNNPEEFFEIINEPHFKKHYTLYDEDKLKKLPSAYVGKSYPEPELLKLKHYIASRQLSDGFFSNPDWKKIIIEDFEKNKRLNQFLNSVFEK